MLMRLSKAAVWKVLGIAVLVLGSVLWGGGSPAFAGSPEIQSGDLCLQESAAPVVDSWSVEKIEKVQRLCCLDEWQPGGCVGRRAAWCNNSCDACGAFICVSSTTNCLK
jgi:hypothetical protein